jgi:hypothetical protein
MVHTCALTLNISMRVIKRNANLTYNMLCPEMQTWHITCCVPKCRPSIWSYKAYLKKQLNTNNSGKKSDNLLFCCTHFPLLKLGKTITITMITIIFIFRRQSTTINNSAQRRPELRSFGCPILHFYYYYLSGCITAVAVFRNLTPFLSVSPSVWF